jgi:DNA-3-methyladenine glycosylase
MPPLPTTAIAQLAPLPRAFYVRDPRTVARDLLGKLLIRRLAPAAAGGPHPLSVGECGEQEREQPTLLAGRIVEAEAYLGALDPGAHTYRGQTPRNAVLFGPPGHAYIYFIYGNHYCTNVSCRAPDLAECDAGGVLLRALEPVCGLEEMAALRGLTERPQPERHRLPRTRPRSDTGVTQAGLAQPTRAQLRLLTSGPGRLSQALGITCQRDNGCDLCSPSSALYIADDGYTPDAITASPRINVTRAPIDEWRFTITGNPFVSGKKLP